MKIVLQRVKNASVTIDGKVKSEIKEGLLALVGFSETDTDSLLSPMAEKMINLRIFEDEDEKMNLSLKDTNGSLICVSQFTLCADCRKGRRPSFTLAKNPTDAERMYDKFVEISSEILGKEVLTGEFGADMKVSLLNDGPVTIILDSDEIVK